VGTQTITLKGRTYTFTTDEANDTETLRVIGSIYNSRGDWAGWVVEDKLNDNTRHVMPPMRVNRDVERAALAGIAA